ncbi:MAG: S4 domain-containing protein YaaA [Erysipelotrichaceae bacterium]
MEIKLDTEYITLGQLLKIADFIQSGGEAKFAVKELAIAVNGEKENRRGRKLYANDTIVIEGRVITLK